MGESSARRTTHPDSLPTFYSHSAKVPRPALGPSTKRAVFSKTSTGSSGRKCGCSCLTPQRDPVFILFVVLKTVWFSFKDMGWFPRPDLEGTASLSGITAWPGEPPFTKEKTNACIFLGKTKTHWETQSLHTPRAKRKCVDEGSCFPCANPSSSRGPELS